MRARKVVLPYRAQHCGRSEVDHLYGEEQFSTVELSTVNDDVAGVYVVVANPDFRKRHGSVRQLRLEKTKKIKSGELLQDIQVNIMAGAGS